MTNQKSASVSAQSMPVQISVDPRPALDLKSWWAKNPPLTIATLASVAICLAALVGLVLDPQVITGVPAWMKPLKFGISSAIYCATFIWLLTFVKGHPRLTGLVSYATTISLVVELGIIVLQVIRGTTSHFNISTPFDAALWSAMAMFIMVIFMAGLLLAILLMFQKMPNAAFGWSLRLAVLVSLLGMGVAFLMTGSPTASQQATMAGGQAPTSFGGHSVGVDDGGPGLPFVGWSTVGGDLRVAHFLGLHALQVLPLLGYLLSLVQGLREEQRVKLVWTAGLGYAALVLILTWQALRGQSLIAPDGHTLAAFGVLLVGVVGAVSLIVRRKVALASVIA
jgi:hypothetical protein